MDAGISSDVIRHSAFVGCATGLGIVRQPTFEEWAGMGAWLRAADKCMAWYIGDWLLLGESLFGESASQMIDAGELTGWSASTLGVYRWVSASIPPTRRRPELDYGHHQIIAAMPADIQDQLLSAAADGPDGVWSVRKLKAHIRTLAGTGEHTYWIIVGAKSEEDADDLVEQMLAAGRPAKVSAR